MGKRSSTLPVLFAILAVCLALPADLYGQVHRNGFESRTPSWVRGPAKASFRELVHDIVNDQFHAGQASEHIQLNVENGESIQYVYSPGRAAINEDLNISVWIKANRPGIQVQGRVVLPQEPGGNLDDRLTTLLRGDTYQLVGRWQRLELRQPVKSAREQQQFMRADLKRDVNFNGAYIDRVVLNLCAGPGMTEVWIDDLDVGPVQESAPGVPAEAVSRPKSADGVTGNPAGRSPARSAVVNLDQDRLLVNGRPFFLLGIQYSGTPFEILQAAGFNTVMMDANLAPDKLEEAVRRNFWLVPSVPVTSNDPRLASAGGLAQEVMRFPHPDQILWWNLGGSLTAEQRDKAARAARTFKLTDPQHLVGGDAWDGLRGYARTFDVLSMHRWPLMTGLEMTQYRDWLIARRRLAGPGAAYIWTWVQTHLPDWFTNLVYEQSAEAPFREPIGPQPEQIRLLSYVALGSGCRGLAFWSDRFLADSHQGRDRLLALALLNQELRTLEPLLLDADQPYWIDGPDEIKGAVLHGPRGVLVLFMWLGKGAQYVPGQSAASRTSIVVPDVPAGATAWLVSPADVRSLQMQRIPGGMQVMIPEIGVTGAVVFTTDHAGPKSLLDYLQNRTQSQSKLAAQWAHDLAQVELEKVARIEDELEQMGHTLLDGKQLMDDARKRLVVCETLWKRGEYGEAYAEAERAMRPLRILMRSQWEQAIIGLDSPTASPYAVSFYTLPRHWRFIQQLEGLSADRNLIPDGDFELPFNQSYPAWSPQESNLDDMEMVAQRVLLPDLSEAEKRALRIAEDKARPRWLWSWDFPNKLLVRPKKLDVRDVAPYLGKQCLRLQIRPRVRKTADGKPIFLPSALERTFLAINSPAVHLPPGTLVRISAWAHIPITLQSSADGALFYDSAGGEPLAIRLTNAMEWKKLTLYRRVPASGTIFVTVALTGLGRVYFDNVSIEPLVPSTLLAGPVWPPTPIKIVHDPRFDPYIDTLTSTKKRPSLFGSDSTDTTRPSGNGP